MYLEIEFNFIGLKFEAGVDYEPGKPAKLTGHPDLQYPAEDETVEFVWLESDKLDLGILLESTLCEYIESAAIEACRKRLEEVKDEST